VGNTHHASSLGFPWLPPPIKIFPGGWLTVGNVFSPSGYPPGWFHHLKFINIFDLPYITIILLACSKSVTTKKCEIKY
jgi:hypothetical protein